MNFKKSQSGRSMVEMLGVLAIIGVLSVGGIAGYSLSMRRHRANGIVDIASKYALIAYNDCQQKLLNGDAKSLTECTYNEKNRVIGFTEAGIGETPAGLASDMYFISIKSDQNTGVDTVTIHITFSDHKLCQAVASITGVNCGDWGANDIRIPFKQN